MAEPKDKENDVPDLTIGEARLAKRWLQFARELVRRPFSDWLLFGGCIAIGFALSEVKTSWLATIILLAQLTAP